MIPSLLSDGDVSTETRLVLVNALYFKGTWQAGFDPGNTQTTTFNTSSSSQVQAPLMNQSGSGTFGLYQGTAFSIAELPYKGGKVALDIVLPATVDGLSALEAGLTGSQLQGWLGQLRQTQLQTLTLPRFKLNTQVALSPALEALGLTLPFDPTQADFSGMDGAHDLSIQAVIHEAVIDVDETGTTAAAATAVGESDAAGAIEYPTFVANHPFLFVLRDLGTGTLLFVGQVIDPTQM
jgi:serpin B